MFCCLFRGHKRKYDESEEEEKGGGEKEEAGDSSDESFKDSNEEEGGSSSEADEMAAALEAELNDFIWYKQNHMDPKNNGQEANTRYLKILFFCCGTDVRVCWCVCVCFISVLYRNNL